MSSEQLVRNCAPTLAGIKTGSLYTYHFRTDEDIRKDIARFNRLMNKKGLRMIPVKLCESYALMYLYRPDMLNEDLKDSLAREILSRYGYSLKGSDRCVVDLVNRLKGNSFPHEIGLFLGYPPSDVLGFIRDPHAGYADVGYWKVYSNVESARAAFRRYRKCTAEYGRMYKSGRTLEQLIV